MRSRRAHDFGRSVRSLPLHAVVTSQRDGVKSRPPVTTPSGYEPPFPRERGDERARCAGESLGGWAEERADSTSGSEAALLGTLTRSEEHTSELQSLMRISYAVFCLKTKK